MAVGGNPQWTSRFAFLMAAIGSAVGLGNLWRFPFQTGANGGAAFVFVYLLCVLLVGIPVLMSELAVGRHKGLSAVGSSQMIATDSGRSPNWGMAGIMGVIGAFLILTTYSVVAGQVMAYSAMAFMGDFSAASAAPETATHLYSGDGAPFFWHTLFMAITVGVVARGLKGGIERAVTILMPIFFVMLGCLAIYALIAGDAGRAINHLFAPDLSKVTPLIALSAMGQALFSMSVGSAIMITYGSFLSREENIGNSAGVIAASDTMVALVSGLVIFPLAFAFAGPDLGLSANEWFGVMFNTLFPAFEQMPGGQFIGGAFFFLAFIAALTSSISLLMVVSTVAEEQFGMNRTFAAVAAGVLCWYVGAVTVFSPDTGSWIDFTAGSVALPIAAILIAVLAGWVTPRDVMRNELQNVSDNQFKLWRGMTRYFVPIAVGAILVLGLIDKFNSMSQ